MVYICIFYEKMKFQNHEIWILIEISSRVEISEGQNFAAFWKTIHVPFERRISFLLIMPEKKGRSFYWARRKRVPDKEFDMRISKCSISKKA